LRKWVSANQLSPFNALEETMHFASYVAIQQIGMPRILWEDDNSRLCVDGRWIPIARFGEMLQALSEDLENTLKWLLLDFDVSSYSTDLTNICDDLNTSTVDYSYINDPRNPYLATRNDLIQHILTDPELSEMFVRTHTPDGRIIYNLYACLEYLQQTNIFTRTLTLLKHFGAGQPIRGTELVLSQLRNTVTRIRNVCIVKGHIGFIGGYNKRGNISGLDKFSLSILPAKSVKSFIHFDWLVKPVQIAFTEACFGKEAAKICSDFLLQEDGHLMSSDWLSDLIYTRTATDLGTGLNIPTYRQAAVAMERRLLPRVVNDDNTTSIYDIQRHHTGPVSHDHYALEQMAILEVSHKMIDDCIEASENWQILHNLIPSREPKAIVPSFTTPSTSKELVPFSQTQPNLPLSGLMTPVQFSELVAETVAQALAVFEIRNPRPIAPSTTPVVRQVIQVTGQTKKLLIEFFNNPQAQFRSPEQAECLQVVLERQRNALFLLPTNAGKSLLYELPAKMTPLHVIVVVPLSALLSDIYLRCKKRGISVERFLPPLGRISAKILLVSVEHTKHAQFQLLVAELHMKKMLGWIFHEECHVGLKAGDYRDGFDSLPWLRNLGVPLIGLSATVHPRDEGRVRSLMGISEALTIRRPSCRLNMAYFKWRTSKKELLYDAIDLIVSLCNKFTLGKGHRIVVFVQERALCELLAEELACLMYHGNMTAMEKERNFCRFAEMQRRPNDVNIKIPLRWNIDLPEVIVCTCAFGVGVDHRQIRACVHIDFPDFVDDLFQETSRAGRDDSPCESHLLYTQAEPRPRAAQDPQSQKMTAYLKCVDCQRLHVESAVDDQAWSCLALSGAEQCGNCEKEIIGVSDE
jgi:helicase-like protein/RAD3-like DEAD/DEAH box helicase